MPRSRTHACLVALTLLLCSALCGLALASEKKTPSGKHGAAKPAQVQTSALLNQILAEQKRFETAEELSALAKTPEERNLAKKAVRLADHAVDVAFITALRAAATKAVATTPEQLQIEARIEKLEARVAAGQEQVARVKQQVAKARGQNKESLAEQQELAEAELDLAHDELTGAREDLISAGGDLKSQIERLKAEHEAGEHPSGAAAAAVTAVAGSPATAEPNPDTALAQARLWFALHGQQNKLEQAQQETLDAADVLRQRHDQVQKETNPAGVPGAAGAAPRGGAKEIPPGTKKVDQSHAAAIVRLRLLAGNQKTLAELDQRTRDLLELAATYENWSVQVAARKKSVTNRLLLSGMWILLIVLVAVGAGRVLQHFSSRLTQDRRLLHTMRSMSRFVVQAIAFALILMIVLGPPGQLGTVLALAGAGLTVALKDFIVGFIGWFMLMGRNGVRVGDWVEINGVCGEVTEITLLHTVLLETGNWTDAGHPTGRKVTFVNSYAIEGHYFNFSTSGQWLWDEVQILVPAGENAHAVADGIQQIASAETEANARLAEEEWRKMAPTPGQRTVSAAPAISIRPTPLGITVSVRYIARANERYEVRARMYHAAVELLQTRGNVPAGDAQPVAPKVS
jgi:small-conductance mechanosensitive channel